MSWYPYYSYPYAAYGIPMQNPEEVPQPWQYVPANLEDFTAATTEPPGILYVSMSLINADGPHN